MLGARRPSSRGDPPGLSAPAHIAARGGARIKCPPLPTLKLVRLKEMRDDGASRTYRHAARAPRYGVDSGTRRRGYAQLRAEDGVRAANPAPGDHVVFTAVVTNQGTKATSAGTVVGVGFDFDGSAAAGIWEDTDTTSLAPGASITLTTSSRKPSRSVRTRRSCRSCRSTRVLESVLRRSAPEAVYQSCRWAPSFSIALLRRLRRFARRAYARPHRDGPPRRGRAS
jgi:hypothetical protein